MTAKATTRTSASLIIIILAAIGTARLFSDFSAKTEPTGGNPSACAAATGSPDMGSSTPARSHALMASDSHPVAANAAASNLMGSAGATDPAAPAFSINWTTGEHAQNAEINADSKEQYMRRRFGVIHRHGKWIPTAGGGTNLIFIVTGTLPAGKVGEPFNVQFQAVGGQPPYQWKLQADQLPEEFVFDQYSGQFSGTPRAPCTVRLLVEAADKCGARDAAEYTLVIQPTEALAILTESLPSAVPGTNFFFQFQAAGGVPPYIWSIVADADFDVLAFDQLAGVLYGEIPPDLPETDIPLTVCLRDAQLEISKMFVLHVGTAPVVLNFPSNVLYQDASFSFSFQASGGSAPYVWEYSGALPPGLEFSSAGVLSGTPIEAGTYEFAVAVWDSAGLSDTIQGALKILPRIPESVDNFEAFLSRNSVALQWTAPAASTDVKVRIVRNAKAPPATPADGDTIYCGGDSSCLDKDIGQGTYYYAAFIETAGIVVTAAPPAVLRASLPPAADPFADRVVETRLLHPNAFRATELPQVVLGAPRGTGLAWGSADVVSLGAAINNDNGATAPYGGCITLEFADNVVWDGPGVDFTIFENVFYICDASGTPDPQTRFMEPAIVSVSQDGVVWRQFKTDFSPRYDPATGRLNLRHPYCYNKGFAGVNPVMSNGLDPDPTDPEMSGGDSFDLAETGLAWIRYVRIQSTGSAWLADDDGDLIYHTEDSEAATRNFNRAGFDLDAIAAIWMEKTSAP